jgi:cell fate regulator YaaT (PSP1 superfamily)
LQTVIGVRFKKAGKMYYFAPGELEIAQDDQVIVETARGVECGLVVVGPKEVEETEVIQPLKMVRRIATEEDLAQIEENKRREKEAFDICEQKIASHGLLMKLVEVEYTFDMNKIIFYFTADGRIDFRELVKDLASVFRTRIELRQIGVRDEAKLMGGIGCCGRPLCCATFLGDFEPVSIRMAKEQNLSLNPAKISGICGRLMCCLKYENECYNKQCPRRQRVQAPERGSHIVSEQGEGKVISLNMQRRTATILLDNGRTIVSSWENIVEKAAEVPAPAEGGAASADIIAATPAEGAEPAADKAAAGKEARSERHFQHRPEHHTSSHGSNEVHHGRRNNGDHRSYHKDHDSNDHSGHRSYRSSRREMPDKSNGHTGHDDGHK